ncbi:hypothetical protein [Cellulomonas carbonis]|uniref:Membrane protein n=1 Tax=Cellulomonas carbonis T26 TaxID=947969 RepID=A0A0A0BUX1_9CELL|nr:hypothetical protein [Cellulomonas carbonis]KGM10964.1 membrane protein [Cellulomonas carbonis T26]GGC02514.1 hypothetical protein GCM10010972_14310 [Cellulomonas carbonis]
MRLPTALVAAVSLVAGFAAAQLTGLRWAGAVVVVAGAAWCVVRERPTTAWWRLAVVVAIGVGAFVLSHVLADLLGAWPAVGVAALALGLVTWLVVDRERTGGDRSTVPR